MILAIDIGNIRTTIALFTQEGTLSFQSELETDSKMTDDRCAIDLMGVFHLYRADLDGVDGAILSSVVPPITGAYARTLRRLTGKPPLVVGPGLKTGLNIRSEIHNQLGSDIVASCVAASSSTPAPPSPFPTSAPAPSRAAPSCPGWTSPWRPCPGTGPSSPRSP